MTIEQIALTGIVLGYPSRSPLINLARSSAWIKNRFPSGTFSFKNRWIRLSCFLFWYVVKTVFRVSSSIWNAPDSLMINPSDLTWPRLIMDNTSLSARKALNSSIISRARPGLPGRSRCKDRRVSGPPVLPYPHSRDQKGWTGAWWHAWAPGRYLPGFSLSDPSTVTFG